MGWFSSLILLPGAYCADAMAVCFGVWFTLLRYRAVVWLVAVWSSTVFWVLTIQCTCSFMGNAVRVPMIWLQTLTKNSTATDTSATSTLLATSSSQESLLEFHTPRPHVLVSSVLHGTMLDSCLGIMLGWTQLLTSGVATTYHIGLVGILADDCVQHHRV